MGPALLLSPLQVGQPREDRAPRPLRAPSPAGGWAGIAGGQGRGGWRSLRASPGSLCLLPCPIQLLPPLWAPGLGFAGPSLAAPRGLGGESADQQFLPQSRTVLSKSSQDRDAFFSSDSAAREWEGPEPKASGTVTKASGMSSRWAHSGKEGWRGVSRGPARVLGGWGRRPSSECPSFSLHS